MIRLQQLWQCPNCRESVEPHFRKCWNCGSDELGNVDPHFVNNAEPAASVSNNRHSGVVNFAWMILAICSFVAIMAAAIVIELILPVQWNIRLSLTLALCILCFLAGVSINVACRLYLWFSEYLHADDPREQSPGESQLIQRSNPENRR